MSSGGKECSLLASSLPLGVWVKNFCEAGSSQRMTLRTATTDEMPRYEEDCLMGNEKALTSSAMPGSLADLSSEPSLESPGIGWRASRLPASGLMCGGFSSTAGVIG